MKSSPKTAASTVQRVTYNEYTVDEVVPHVRSPDEPLFYRKQSKVMTLEEGHDGQDTVVYTRSRSTAIDPRRMNRACE